MPDAPAVPELPPVTPPVNPYADYNPQGAMGGLFAPAYIQGYAPSEQAVLAWQQANRPIGGGDVDLTRMPELWKPPSATVLKNAPYSKGVPATQNYMDPRGTVDTAALRAASMGGPYDLEARREAIAQRLLENAQLEAAWKAANPIPLKQQHPRGM